MFIKKQHLLNYYNVTIIYDSLPAKINGIVTNYKGINLIFINKNYEDNADLYIKMMLGKINSI